jgi:hypothetical protein
LIFLFVQITSGIWAPARLVKNPSLKGLLNALSAKGGTKWEKIAGHRAFGNRQATPQPISGFHLVTQSVPRASFPTQKDSFYLTKLVGVFHRYERL